ncbi:MAG: topoisomerase [Actinomycetota bacterium]|nr:topoisomerase [Actinomycetota bacterium]
MAARPKTSAAGTGTRPPTDDTDDDTRRLVIVESPAKAKTIAGYLGRNYIVESSIGHIRDLPTSAADIPAKYKKEPWSRLGVDVDHGFEPLYVINADKRQQVAKLKSALASVDELYLATDEDREGEAIAWHLLEVLKPTVPVHRMVFHEITRDAIREAARHPRELNQALVDAQETRRILDRLYGYEVSPVLWKKVMPRLSAGRVQSVATRMVVERERERIAFRSASYWDIDATFAADPAFDASLVGVDGKRVAVGRDFDSVGRLKSADLVHLDEGQATELAAGLSNTDFIVRSVESKPYRRSPAAPFMTSTLQQEASRKLRFSSQTTMRVAQRLYESGHITYMRTDSTTLSETALNAARAQVRQLYGAEFSPDAPRRYEKKVKNAQEAHEAIRPSGDQFRTPGELAGEVSGDELRLYELIWQRTLASQMTDATGNTVTVRLGATARNGQDAEFSASGTVIVHAGFLKVYVEGSDDEADDTSRERRLPSLSEGDIVRADDLRPVGHSTNPPARYTEASLVRALEERGIGRPSTFASIMGTILDRGYVFKKGSALVPTFLAFAVVQLLERHFGDLVDYDFTAEMEEDLDRIADGETARTEWLTRFYFGAPLDDPGQGGSAGSPSPVKNGPGPGKNGPGPGLKAMVSDRLAEIDARDVSSFPLGDSGIVVRVGRYGTYLERDGQRANVPDGVAPDEVTQEYAQALLDKPSGDRPLGVDPGTGLQLVAKDGRYGPYVTEILPEDTKAKPRTASLFQSMSLDTVTLDDALRLLTLPRILGTVEGEEVVASNGRYGPYVKQGAETRSIESEEQLLTITLEQALEVLAQPKLRGRRAAAAGPLRELGVDVATQKPVVVRDGRFGAYVTDGETNATLRKGDDVESITLERAAELLADKRARGPAPKKTAARKPAAKKTAGKKVAKKTVKKAAAKRG